MRNWKDKLTGVAVGTLKSRTLAEIYGKDRVLIEQHRGILSYGTERIRIGATYGHLVVEGDGLRICCMSRSQLVIRGSIQGLWMEAD